MLRVTKLTDYATVVLTALAARPDAVLSAPELAERAGLELPTVAKLLKPLAQAGLVEGFRGDVLAWVRLDGDHVARCHLRDPSWFQWPLLEAAIEGNIVADFPLCNKSFNCSYSGHDL